MKEKIKNSNLIEIIIVSLLIFMLDIIFAIRYNTNVFFTHWLISYFKIFFAITILSFIKNKKVRYGSYLTLSIFYLIIFAADAATYFYKQDLTAFNQLFESVAKNIKVGIKYNPLKAINIFGWISIVLVFTGSFYFLYKYIFKIKNESKRPKYINKIILGLSILTLIITPYLIQPGKSLMYNRPSDKTAFIKNFSLSTYHVKEIEEHFKNLYKTKIKANEIKQSLDVKIGELIEADKSDSFGLLKDENVIFIMMETAEQYGFMFDELTPNYNKLKNNGLYFDNFYSPAANFKTYDAEFKSQTSLMYFLQDNYMYTKGSNKYNSSLANVLKANGYQTNSIHNFEKTFFNRAEVHPNIGFENSYFLEEMIEKVGEEVKDYQYWPLDRHMFNNFLDEIAPTNLNQPFYSYVLSVTAHGPHNVYKKELKDQYEVIEKYIEENEEEFSFFNNLTEEEILSFKTLLAGQMELDQGIGKLIEHLETNNLMDKTTLVLFSDHRNYSSGSLTKKMTENSHIPFEEDKVPLIIHSSKIKSGVNNTLSSIYDLTPTMFDLLGIRYYENYYHGQSLFLKNRKDTPIIFSPSKWITKDMVVYDGVQYINHNEGYYEVKETDFWKTRVKVFETIKKYEDMFLSNYLEDKITYIK